MITDLKKTKPENPSCKRLCITRQNNKNERVKTKTPKRLDSESYRVAQVDYAGSEKAVHVTANELDAKLFEKAKRNG